MSNTLVESKKDSEMANDAPAPYTGPVRYMKITHIPGPAGRSMSKRIPIHEKGDGDTSVSKYTRGGR